MKFQSPLLIILLCAACFANAQPPQKLDFNKEYKDIALREGSTLVYTLSLPKGGMYQFSILQQGIAVYYILTDGDKKLYESNYPDDISGYEKFEYSTIKSENCTLTIKRFDDPQNPDSGKISILVKSLTKTEMAIRNRIKKELEPENAKNVTTVDIDHFWAAFDHLKNCRTFSDSVNAFQQLYLDKATDGLLDFAQVRAFTAERFVEAVSKNAAFYQSVRKHTYDAKKAEPVIEEVFAKFKEIYPAFKPFKVCFAIGIKNTGGTVSNQFVLIGTEVTVATGEHDTATSEDIVRKIKGIVAHECVHTQQKPTADPNVIQCPLLYQSIKEGSCDFIAELITGQSRNNEYGENHEKELWAAFKNELCNQDIGNWLYNGFAAKDKPGDLGYFIGYQIAKEYYKNAIDKSQAIVEIIGTVDPIHFLEMSRYDQKVRK